MATRARRFAAAAAVLGASMLFAAPAHAHDDIVGSDPESGTVIDEPITEVTIEFGVPVNDDVELALFGPGDDNLIHGTTTTILSPTSAKIEFPPVEEKGMYIVRYLSTATVDQHFLVGAVSFTYGSAGGSGASGLNWLLFAIPMIIILAIGTAWSYRLHRQQTAENSADDDSDVDEDLSNV